MVAAGDVVVVVEADWWSPVLGAVAALGAVYFGARLALRNERRKRAEELWLSWADELSNMVTRDLFDAVGQWAAAEHEVRLFSDSVETNAPVPDRLVELRRAAFRSISITGMRFTQLETRLTNRGGQPRDVDMVALRAAGQEWRTALAELISAAAPVPSDEDEDVLLVNALSKAEIVRLTSDLRSAAQKVTMIAEPALGAPAARQD